MIQVTDYKGWRISVSDDGAKWMGRNDEDFVDGPSMASVKAKIDAALKKASDFKPYMAWMGERPGLRKVKVTSVVEDEQRSYYGSGPRTGSFRVSWKGSAGNTLRQRVSAAEIFPVGWEPNDEVAKLVAGLIRERKRINTEIAGLVKTMTSVEERPDAEA